MTTPKEVQPQTWSHFNGSASELLDRYAIAELCKGWPVYRDASEWANFRSIFCKDDPWTWTTWSGPQRLDDFIKISQKGKANGDFIMHRECGTLVDLNPATSRAIGKMKATITQRFNIDGVAFDVDCDCRFIFFCFKEKQPSGDYAWKAKFNKLFYEKDKIVPTNGKDAPTFPKEELDKYPNGYKYLAVAQHKLGHPIDPKLPTLDNEYYWRMYEEMNKWLEGKDVDLFWE